LGFVVFFAWFLVLYGSNTMVLRNISFLISCYAKDSPVFLEEALYSINESSGSLMVQVIIVCDGPIGDALQAVLEIYRSKSSNNISICRLETNLGLGLALRHGAALCTGDYIFRLDSDDISIAARVERCVVFMDEHPEVSAVGGAIEEFNYAVGDRSQFRNVPLGYDAICDFSKLRNPMNHVTVCFRKSFFDTVTYDHMPLYEDYFLWINAIDRKLVLANLSDVFVHVRVASGIGDRRSGLNYLQKDIHFARAVLGIGYFGYFGFFRYLLSRLLIRLMPNGIITWFYRTFLRS
jgi:glycosyltransferase involved in cell wall biosynthesis